jgi:2-keto-4-pentenoate hydratase/2-oxohepta-3-ene-1,7-dioic acid hydratase in catechol pathway
VKLATFTQGHSTRIGVVQDEHIVDLSTDTNIPTDMIAALRMGEAALQLIKQVVAAPVRRFYLEEVRLEAPVLAPRKFLGLGGSYESHLREVARFGITRSPHQTWFNKQVTCVNGPYDDIHMPRVSATLDYEGELAVVIGKMCKGAKRADAAKYIAGFTVCNDVSVREYQMRAATHTLGKSFDTHGPIGPWIVTSDELQDARNLSLKTWVNDELRQDGNTRELLWSFEEMLEELSTVFTLEPGDILATGTPAGVGGARMPPQYLSIGDVVRVEIEGIGFIRNRVVAEPEVGPAMALGKEES